MPETKAAQGVYARARRYRDGRGAGRRGARDGDGQGAGLPELEHLIQPGEKASQASEYHFYNGTMKPMPLDHPRRGG